MRIIREKIMRIHEKYVRILKIPPPKKIMLSTRIYFDSRKKKGDREDKLYPVCLVFSKNGTSASKSLGIKIRKDQWCNNEVVNHPQKLILNQIISAKKGEYDKAILELSPSGTFAGKSAKESLIILQDYLDPEEAKIRLEKQVLRDRIKKNFAHHFETVIASKDNAGTRKLYEDTYKKVYEYCSSQKIDFFSLQFEDITKNWLESFENFCLKTQQQNTASRHLRDIRAVFNDAINEGITNHYPFKKFKIKVVQSRDKSYTAAQLRELFNYPCYPGREQESVQIFTLMFCLIGINPVDLSNLKESDIRNGRIDYLRRKTKKLYSIKIEPEAMKIINACHGQDYLIKILDESNQYKTYFRNMARSLRHVGLVRANDHTNNPLRKGKALLPNICAGSARTSWATIAQDELDIDRETIAAALGHHTVDVTDTYLRTKWRKKVDEANRRVIDWVFYGKK